MLRALALATLLTALPAASAVQAPSILNIKVVVKDADGRATPVPRYLLLVSENPPSAPPRRVMTALDGTTTVRLRPGNYTIESDQPFAFQGKLYTWIATLDVVPSREAALELTAENAEVEAGDTPSARSSADTESAMLQAKWQDSVVSIWTPTAHGSGFSIGANGLIATSHRVVGSAAAIEVQLSRPSRLRRVSSAPTPSVAWRSCGSIRRPRRPCSPCRSGAVRRGSWQPARKSSPSD